MFKSVSLVDYQIISQSMISDRHISLYVVHTLLAGGRRMRVPIICVITTVLASAAEHGPGLVTIMGCSGGWHWHWTLDRGASEADTAQCLGGGTNMSFIHHAIAKKIKEDKDKDKLASSYSHDDISDDDILFRSRMTARSRQCWGASRGTAWSATPSQSRTWITLAPPTGGGRSASGSRSPSRMYHSGVRLLFMARLRRNKEQIDVAR